MQVTGHYYSKIFGETKKVHGIKSCHKLVVKLTGAFECNKLREKNSYHGHFFKFGGKY